MKKFTFITRCISWPVYEIRANSLQEATKIWKNRNFNKIELVEENVEEDILISIKKE